MLLLTFLSLVLPTFALAVPVRGDVGNCPTTSPEDNKALTLEFYTTVINETNFDTLDRFIGDKYIQHNPWVPDGKEGLRTNLKPLLKNGGTKDTLRIARIIAADDFVWMHSRAIVLGKPNALIDIFRFECGRVAEHWDVIMEMVPSKVNDHAYF